MICITCDIDKPEDLFYRDRGRKSGRRSDCKKCNDSKRDPEKHRLSQRKRDSNKTPEAKAEKRQYMREWCANNKDKIRNADLIRKYGIDRKEYEAILAAQGGVCAICGSADPKGHGEFHVDHAHDETKKVRGLLCSNCNFGLGLFKDSVVSLELAIMYLRKE
jgi:hypothetical protein